MPGSARPPAPASAAHYRAELVRLDAELAQAYSRRERLRHASAVARYTAGCRGRRHPDAMAQDLAQLDADIAQLESARARLLASGEIA